VPTDERRRLLHTSTDQDEILFAMILQAGPHIRSVHRVAFLIATRPTRRLR
jgi:hypothetical protein